MHIAASQYNCSTTYLCSIDLGQELLVEGDRCITLLLHSLQALLQVLHPCCKVGNDTILRQEQLDCRHKRNSAHDVGEHTLAMPEGGGGGVLLQGQHRHQPTTSTIQKQHRIDASTAWHAIQQSLRGGGG